MTMMRAFRIAHHRIRSLVRQDAVDAEVARELSFHFDQLVAEHLASGLSPADARAAAHRQLGNVAALQDQCRDHRRVSWFQDLYKDIQYGWRTLSRDRSFVVVAAISLALGLGATAAALSALHALTLGALPYPAVNRLVSLRTFPAANPSQLSGVPLDDYFEWKERSRSFEVLGISLGFPADLGADEHGAPAERLEGCLFDAGMLDVLGVRPRLGRVFTDDDPRFSMAGSVVVISDALWASRYGRDPGIIGRNIRLNRTDVTIVGVMPPTFYYPDNRVDFWGPLRPVRGGPRGERLHNVAGRLRPGVKLEDAAAELSALSDREWGVGVRTLRDAMFGWAVGPLATVGAAAVLVLLMACANVAALLLARGTVRGPEIALRVALGASRSRIVRQFVTESVLLAMLSAALSLGVAWLSLRAFALLAPLPGVPSIPPIDLNVQLLGLTTLLGAIAGISCGVVPALRCSNGTLARDVGGGHKTTPSAGQFRIRAMLVAIQVAASFVLLVGAALLGTSFARLAVRNLNYDPDRLVMFDFRIPPLEYARPAGTGAGSDREFSLAPMALATLDRVLERLRIVPGVVTAAGISHHPTNSFVLFRAPLSGEGTSPADDTTRPAYFLVTPGFFETMRTPVVRGREFTDADTPSSRWGAVVNETMARRFWPGQDPIGQQVRLALSHDERPRQIIGVVRDIPTRRAQVVAEPVIYASIHQQSSATRAPWVGMFGRMTFVVRTAGAATVVVPAIRNAVAEVEPDRPIASVSSTPVQPYMWGRYSYVFVVGGFALVALLIATFGVYGVMSYVVAQRSREIAIRLALGANARDVLATVGRQALVVVVSGLVVGVLGALVGARLLTAQLWGVTPTDPATFIAIGVLLSIVAGAACRAPVRRALRTDPVAALKYDGGS